jgi:hypothetical protein
LLKEKQVVVDQKIYPKYMFCNKIIGNNENVNFLTKVELVEFDTIDDAFICVTGDKI